MEQPITTTALTASHTASKKVLASCIQHFLATVHLVTVPSGRARRHLAQARVQVNMQNAQEALNLSAGRFRKSLNQKEMQFSGREKSANLSAVTQAGEYDGGEL